MKKDLFIFLEMDLDIFEMKYIMKFTDDDIVGYIECYAENWLQYCDNSIIN